MKVLAIYAVNEHIAQLMNEAEQARLARRADRGPSAIRRLIAAIRPTAGASRSTSPAPA